jgi:peptidoglycan hydrolase CwlO-like protein
MKRITTILSTLVATLLISAMPVVADEGSWGTMIEEGQQSEKNECLLASLNCGNQVDTIQQRIDRLQGEIARGTDVYSADELKTLNDKLEDANRTLEFMMNDGGA